eukprot:TRINITY_DN1244_c0_g1_i1.p1 TRINITY_DN1244_c0_g1~~TRINITY_DN1244_c0_g1_i1.p1  ORF type:complete len:1568 (+),score=469.39 TRINITY_DN1244_c0_g1_i1:84-4787(+)
MPEDNGPTTDPDAGEDETPQGSPVLIPSKPATPPPQDPGDATRTLALTPAELQELVRNGPPGARASPGSSSPGSGSPASGGRGRARGTAFRYTSIESYEEGGYLTKPIKQKSQKNDDAAGVRVGMCDMQGWRKTMEDAHCVKSEGGRLFVGVFDGHCGDQAAKLVADVLPDEVLARIKLKGLRQSLAEAFEKTDSRVVAAMDAMPCGAGCTAVTLLASADGRLACAWAGDARAVLCRGGLAIPLSNDHKPQGPREQKRIEEAGGTVGQGRVSCPGAQGRLAVARAFGDAPFKKLPHRPLREQPITAMADITVVQLTHDDEFVVLACDGIWERMTDQQVVTKVAGALKDSNDLAVIGGDVCDACLADTAPGKGCDNMTIGVVSLGAFAPRACMDGLPLMETTSHDLEEQWKELLRKGEIPPGDFRRTAVDSDSPALSPAPQKEDVVIPLSQGHDGDSETKTLPVVPGLNVPHATSQDIIGEDEVKSAVGIGTRDSMLSPTGPPVKPLFPDAPNLPSHGTPSAVPISGAVSGKAANGGSERRKLTLLPLGLTGCLGAAAMCGWFANQGALAGLLVHAVGVVLWAAIAGLSRLPTVSRPLFEIVLCLAAIWSIAADILGGLGFSMWPVGAAVLCGMPVGGAQLGPCMFVALAVGSWMVIRTVEEAEGIGIKEEMPDDGMPHGSQGRLRFLVGWGWEYGWGALISRTFFTWMAVAVGFACGRGIRDSVERWKKICLICHDICDAAAHLDAQMADRVALEADLGGVPRHLQKALHNVCDAIRMYKSYVPDGVVFVDRDTEKAASGREGSSDDGPRSPGVNRRETAAAAGIAWESSSAGSKSTGRCGSKAGSDHSGRRNSGPHRLSPRMERGHSFSSAKGGAAAQLQGLLRTKKGTIMLAEIDLERLDPQETQQAVHHFCANVLDCAKHADATVVHIAGANILLTWNTHRPVSSHGAMGCNCAVAVEHYMKALSTEATTRAWWSIMLAAGNSLSGVTGSSEHKSPIVLGHPAAVAMTVGPLIRAIGVTVGVTDQVYEQIRAHTYARPVDVVCIPQSCMRSHKSDRRERTDVIYEVYGPRDRGTPSMATLYVEAFCDLQRGLLEDAREKFLGFLKANSGDRQAQRLTRLCVWLQQERLRLPVSEHKGYVREMIGWEDLEANSENVQLDDKVAAAVGRLEHAAAEPISSSNWSDMEPRRRKKESVQHDKVLRRQIREAEALHNADQLVAWGLMPDKPDDTPDSKGVPLKFTDHRDRVWCRAQRCLGKGAFGEVWLGMGSEGGLVAIKTMSLPMPRMQEPSAAPQGGGRGEVMTTAARRRLARKRQQGGGGGAPAPAAAAAPNMKEHLSQIEDLLREVGLMHKLKHENIVQYLTSAVVNGYIMIVMEFLSGGSLSDVLSQFGGTTSGSGLPLSSIQRYTRDIVRGLTFLHSNDIIHRDMKPHNVLLLVEGQCKLADFGASAQLNQLASSNQGVIGTPLYMGPEAARGAACKASDVWGLGCILCQLFSGEVPYTFTDDEPFNPHTFLFKLANVDGFAPTIPPQMTPEARSFALKCLRKDPDERPTAAELEKDPFTMS